MVLPIIPLPIEFVKGTLPNIVMLYKEMSDVLHGVSFQIVFFESVAVTKLSPNMISTGPRGILGLVKIIFGGQIIEQFLN